VGAICGISKITLHLTTVKTTDRGSIPASRKLLKSLINSCLVQNIVSIEAK